MMNNLDSFNVWVNFNLIKEPITTVIEVKGLIRTKLKFEGAYSQKV